MLFATFDYIDWVREGKRIDTKEAMSGGYCPIGYVREINVTNYFEGVAEFIEFENVSGRYIETWRAIGSCHAELLVDFVKKRYCHCFTYF